jgi:hypothetical protein
VLSNITKDRRGKRNREDDSGGEGPSRPSLPPRTATLSNPTSAQISPVNDNLLILSSFDTPGQESSDLSKDNSMKYHGRPLELTCAMMRLAYTETMEEGWAPAERFVWDEELRARLEPG